MRHQWKRYVWPVSLVLVTLAIFTLSDSAVPNPVDPLLHPTLYVRCEGHHPNFSTIQAAVDAAGGGYTIKVCEGTYTETVNVNDATKHGSAPFNTLDGLRIEAGEEVKLRCPYGVRGVLAGTSGFDLHANRVEIKGFDISECESAISVEFGFGGELFSENRLHDNTRGISFNSSSGNNSVVYNDIYGNSGDGVFDFGPRGDYIFSNKVRENGANGIEISTTSLVLGIPFGCYFTAAVIVDNEASNNANHGILLNTADCVHVKWNTLEENGNDGLHLNPSHFCVIAGNEADENTNDGIELSSGSTLNTLQDNRMQKNKAFDAGDHSSAPGNTWQNNHCSTKSGTAVCVL